MGLPYVRLHVVASGVAESPRLEAKRMDEIAAVARALNFLADLIEARGEYYYEEQNVKRWILDGGGKSGNCETCEDNADRDWIPDEDTFEDVEGGDIDGPPAHPNCECELEYKEKRVRVYV